MNDSDIIAALQPVVEMFEKLGVQYFIGGSVASSAYGIARATLDVDLISNLKKEQVVVLVESLKSQYYVSEQAVLDAIQRSTSFNLIHLETMLKVDVFILKNTPYDQMAFSRKQKDTLDEEISTTFYLGSVEDILLSKLNWFRMGGEVSDQQWKDILGILKVQRDQIDLEYLKHWAMELRVWDLLEKALEDAGGF